MSVKAGRRQSTHHTPDISPAFRSMLFDDASQLDQADEVYIGILMLVRPLSRVNEERLG